MGREAAGLSFNWTEVTVIWYWGTMFWACFEGKHGHFKRAHRQFLLCGNWNNQNTICFIVNSIVWNCCKSQHDNIATFFGHLLLLCLIRANRFVFECKQLQHFVAQINIFLLDSADVLILNLIVFKDKRLFRTVIVINDYLQVPFIITGESEW